MSTSTTSTTSTTGTASATTTTTTNNNNNNGGLVDQSADRIKKRDPGRITKVIKCGVVGDGTVGKTTLLLSYITQAFITEYTPTVFDNFSAIEEVEDGKLVNVILWDTAGQDDYAQIRTTCYTNCRYDVFLLCFSVVNRDSFDNVKYKWLPELKANSPGTPFILVGTKTDMRDNNAATPQLSGQSPVITFKEGQKRAKEIKAHNYMECTSRDPASVAKVVLEAVGIIMERDKVKRVANEKIWKKEVKKEEKEEKLIQKSKEKMEKQGKFSKKTPSPSNQSPEASPKLDRASSPPK
ncbi:Rho GTPase [Cavenderia fasciculata]|uniref:Rho GTPase n=1 Tax=Cavenderia fasciculata TaxID=261658 RepID=F4Q8R2_CACFS|nr:Rho GTPase [Cavenderia fasciculata]EGG15081.1 Rho GTPase [Cavenderia fasciculata]|eukprot:XP_004351801.1 Rho GTPase [Cavenderia fasciculata]